VRTPLATDGGEGGEHARFWVLGLLGASSLTDIEGGWEG
jgi:hypothetical protein